MLSPHVFLVKHYAVCKVNSKNTKNDRRRDVDGNIFHQLYQHPHKEGGEDLREEECAVECGKIQANAPWGVNFFTNVTCAVGTLVIIFWTVMVLLGMDVDLEFLRNIAAIFVFVLISTILVTVWQVGGKADSFFGKNISIAGVWHLRPWHENLERDKVIIRIFGND